ncbi:hypothetical protein NL676_031413 [Syzygium grande]|nr:hypothetical protein NL676_031413 [Syzygium grande]
MSLELDGGPYDVHARRGSILLDGLLKAFLTANGVLLSASEGDTTCCHDSCFVCCEWKFLQKFVDDRIWGSVKAKKSVTSLSLSERFLFEPHKGSLIFKYPILTGVRFCSLPNGIKGKQKSENKKINHKNEKDPLREKVSASEESRKLHFILYNLL